MFVGLALSTIRGTIPAVDIPLIGESPERSKK
jgi:hypothetical protein